MTATYTWADKTCDKVDAQIWVVYYSFRDKFTHPFIKARTGAEVNKMADIRVEELFDSNVYFGLSKVTTSIFRQNT